ncbi:Unannotated [Lentimonas sp. CC19]|nr:Unannotated [Lentimonas sp. CC4]CAA6684012.1 Unannotated [Lentimonas sp. CC6]CAA6689878.1 Unannotated [Lentimonas sp. CC10]CAA6697151.1 Unannotated [Lentimonas sp. CC19]CAA7069425.1 Unannotated [Lentimonas sp. CC11]CAA7170059.1 Unannotated [Lentimonas sp. CC21]CAA7181344.1 Unannotated [Lentimonas sp. CC8]
MSESVMNANRKRPINIQELEVRSQKLVFGDEVLEISPVTSILRRTKATESIDTQLLTALLRDKQNRHNRDKPIVAILKVLFRCRCLLRSKTEECGGAE